MKAKIIGSGAWEGIPALFCRCKTCKNAIDNPASKNFRTRPSLYFKTDEGEFMVEISPDIKLQTVRNNLSNIKNFIVSHWHFDHMYGLLELHTWTKFKQKINIYCSQKTKDWLDKNFGHIIKDVIVLKPFIPFSLYGIKITPFPVYHMFNEDNTLTPEQLNNTFGFVFEKDNKKVVYLSDYYKVPKKSLELIQNADIVVADGTYLFEEMFPLKEIQEREKSDTDHLHGNEIIKFVKTLNSKRVVFHSVSHLTEKNHEELQKLLPENFQLSYDGTKISGYDNEI
jgi:phosphoribosyl 1,2-cyclic phosphate phosphodiesterase